MNKYELFKQIKSEFNEQIALGVCIAVTINLTTKPNSKDFITPNRYSERVNKKILERLNRDDFTQEDIKTILKLFDCVHNYDIGLCFDGLGGATKKTFKELLEMKT